MDFQDLPQVDHFIRLSNPIILGTYVQNGSGITKNENSYWNEMNTNLLYHFNN